MDNFKHRQTHLKNNNTKNQIVHYRITRMDKFIMSFHSLYAVVLLLFIIGVFYKIDNVFSLNSPIHGFIDAVIQSIFLTLFFIIGIIVLIFCYGLLLSHIQFNNYQVSSNKHNIYISKGSANPQCVTIQRTRIHRIVIEKPITRCMFRLVTIKLHYIQATSSDSIETTMLIPFIRERRAKELFEEILPDYTVETPLSSLPGEAYFVELIQPNYLLVIITFLIMFFWPELWVVPILHAIYLIIKRVLKTKRQQYNWNHDVIAIRTGSFSPSLHVINRKQITMLQIHQSWLQRKLKIATCQVTTQNNSVELEHVSEDIIERIYDWFLQQ